MNAGIHNSGNAFGLAGMLSQAYSANQTVAKAPEMPTDVHPYLTTISTPGDVEKGMGVLLYPCGNTDDVKLMPDAKLEITELASPYNRARYTFEAKKVEELFDTAEINALDTYLSEDKFVFPIVGYVVRSEKGVGKRQMAATRLGGLPIWHTDFHRRVANYAAKLQREIPDLTYEEVRDYVVAHERTHHAVTFADVWDSLTRNVASLEKRLEGRVYDFYMDMAEKSEGEAKASYLRKAKIAEGRISSAKRTYSRKARAAKQKAEEGQGEEGMQKEANESEEPDENSESGEGVEAAEGE